MLSCRCWASSSTLLRYTRGRRLLDAPDRLRADGAVAVILAGTLAFHALHARGVDPGVLPLGRHELADRARHRPVQRLDPPDLDRPRARGTDYLCVHRDDPRGGDRARRLHGRTGRAKEEAGDRPPRGSLHHLRLRPRGPPRRPRVPGSGRQVRRARLQRRRASSTRASTASSSSRATGRTTRISRQRGSRRAKGLVASSDSDVDNLYITLSARTARPTCSSSRAHPTRTSPRSCAARAPTASSSRIRPRARRWRRSCSSRRLRRSSRP